MTIFKAGLVHTPVTPFTREERIDYDVYAKLIEFHLRSGAQSLALPMHAGESVSLTDVERQELLEFALRQVKGRVPVIAHVSQAGTSLAATLARHAAQAGAAAVVATTPQPFASTSQRWPFGHSSPAATRDSSVLAYHHAIEPSGGRTSASTARNRATET